MAYDIYSERTKRAKLLQIEQYSELPKTLRNQIVSIVDQIITLSESEAFWHTFCDEKGKDQQEKYVSYNPQDPNDCEAAMGEYQSLCHKQIKEGTIEDVFDVVDIAFQMTSKDIGTKSMPQEYLQNKMEKYHWAIEEINIRFERAGVGYRLVNNRIERKILHLDLALPALDVLRDEGFEHTRNNFYLAHRHYQSKNYADCVTNANKSFESLLKALCKQQKLKPKNDKNVGELVKTLLNHLFSNDKFSKEFAEALGFSRTFKLSPAMSAHFGRHGSGPQDEETSIHMARYALHLAATNILFFMQAVEAKNESTKVENVISNDEAPTDQPSTNNSGGGNLDDDIPF